MQQQNSLQEQKKGMGIGKRITLWGALGGGLILATLAGILWFYIEMPMHVNRDLSDDLPWKHQDLVIDNATAAWKDATGNPILAKRTRLYPEVSFNLVSAPGKGRIDVIFLNPDGTQVGDTHNLRYADGQFEKRQDRISETSGNKATVWLETGYTSTDFFDLHRANQEENLWRAVFYYRPDGNNKAIRLGQLSVKAELVRAEGGK